MFSSRHALLYWNTSSSKGSVRAVLNVAGPQVVFRSHSQLVLSSRRSEPSGFEKKNPQMLPLSGSWFIETSIPPFHLTCHFYHLITKERNCRVSVHNAVYPTDSSLSLKKKKKCWYFGKSSRLKGCTGGLCFLAHLLQIMNAVHQCWPLSKACRQLWAWCPSFEADVSSVRHENQLADTWSLLRTIIIYNSEHFVGFVFLFFVIVVSSRL